MDLLQRIKYENDDLGVYAIKVIIHIYVAIIRLKVISSEIEGKS